MPSTRNAKGFSIGFKARRRAVTRMLVERMQLAGSRRHAVSDGGRDCDLVHLSFLD